MIPPTPLTPIPPAVAQPPTGTQPGFVPGQTPRFFQDDIAIPLKKGTDFVLQMHYHPTGKEETDQTTVSGLR